jgi:hypothetical protein
VFADLCFFVYFDYYDKKAAADFYLDGRVLSPLGNAGILFGFSLLDRWDRDQQVQAFRSHRFNTFGRNSKSCCSAGETVSLPDSA